MTGREDILRRVAEVEQMPAAVQQVMQVVSNQDSSMEDVAAAVSLDPGLTANLLRLANSSYFGGVREISSVREAVVRIGAKRVFELAVAAGVAPRVARKVSGYDLPPGSLLVNAIATAVAAESLARHVGIRVPEETFTAGLLANIGKTVLSEFLEVDAEPILRLVAEEGLAFDEAERRVLGTDHAEVGAELLRHWGLPPSVVDVVRHHLHPEQAEHPGTTLDLVHLGAGLAAMASMGLGLDGLNYTLSEDAAKRLGVDATVMDEVTAEILDKVEELGQIFQHC